MHEMSVAIGVVEIAEQSARDNGASRILSVTLEVGDLSGVMADALEFCYQAAAKGTMAEGSRLILERISARAYCPSCEAEFPADSAYVLCPKCKGFVSLTSGEELRVRDVEVE